MGPSRDSECHFPSLRVGAELHLNESAPRPLPMMRFAIYQHGARHITEVDRYFQLCVAHSDIEKLDLQQGLRD